ncbi:hypothetical protein HN799_01230 [Candidatus Woesearchaeota archaeon]|nr:hypothetical protein [Candidatus Woesearchaeota archaeon]MBT7331874.1 hypothetical protein [Candidatus Woesearchaeota archaeon]
MIRSKKKLVAVLLALSAFSSDFKGNIKLAKKDVDKKTANQTVVLNDLKKQGKEESKKFQKVIFEIRKLKELRKELTKEEIRVVFEINKLKNKLDDLDLNYISEEFSNLKTYQKFIEVIQSFSEEEFQQFKEDLIPKGLWGLNITPRRLKKQFGDNLNYHVLQNFASSVSFVQGKIPLRDLSQDAFIRRSWEQVANLQSRANEYREEEIAKLEEMLKLNDKIVALIKNPNSQRVLRKSTKLMNQLNKRIGDEIAMLEAL